MKNEMNSTTWTFASLIRIAMKLILVATLLVVVVVASSGCGTNRRILSGNKVQALFSGKTVTGYHEKKGYSSIGYYEPAGTFPSYQSGRILSGDEVQALFAGKTVRGHHEKHGYSFISYYEPTGTFRSYQGGSKEPRLGKWWVNSSGDICVRWEDESEDLCRKMVTDDKGHYWKVLIKSNGKRILIVTFESFVNGDVIDEKAIVEAGSIKPTSRPSSSTDSSCWTVVIVIGIAVYIIAAISKGSKGKSRRSGGGCGG